MLKNGYTKSYVEAQINRYLAKIYSPRDVNEEPKYGPEKLRVYIKLPYIGEASKKLEASIKGCLRRVNGGLLLVVINSYRRVQHWFPYKDKTPAEMKSNVVYKLECSCGKCYIGETERNLVSRLDEHKKTTGKLTTVGEHLRDNPTCEFYFDKVEILGRTDKFRIKYLESLFIQKYASTGTLINEADSSKPLYLFNIPIELKSKSIVTQETEN